MLGKASNTFDVMKVTMAYLLQEELIIDQRKGGWGIDKQLYDTH